MEYKMEILRASIIYKCPKTDQKIQFKINAYSGNHWVYSRDYYGSDNYYIKIYECKSCGKEHEIELN